MGTGRPQGRHWGPVVGQGESRKVKEGWPLHVWLWEAGLKKELGEAFSQVVGQYLSRVVKLGYWEG